VGRGVDSPIILSARRLDPRQRMHILHVTTFLQGGAGRAITSLALAQRRAGHDVLLVQDDGGDTGYSTYPEYRDALMAGGVRLLSVSSTFKRGLDVNTQAARRIADALAQWPVDIAHAHAAVPSMVARLALGSRPVPVVQTMHGWGIAKSAEHTRTDVALLNLADAVVTPSNAARAMLHTLGVTRPVTVVPYGIDDRATRDTNDPIDPIDPIDRALFERLRATALPIALCIGTIGARKNQRLLVEAMAAPGAPALHAVFIGDGEEDTLRADAATRGVDSRVHVLGYRRDASRYLPLGDLLVLPSRNEGLPFVVLEALRDGVPIVASAIPEIAEAVDPGDTGYLFEPESSIALAASLAAALGARADRTAAMRQRANGVFRARYTLDRMVSAYDRLYADLQRRDVPARAG
jgi:L-malate glycosyltransferase